MGTYRVQICRRVWETAYVDIDDVDAPDEAVARAEEYLDRIDEDALDWMVSAPDSHAEVEGVVEVADDPPFS